MCKYCENVSTGDDWTPISTADIDFGFAGKIILDLTITRENNKPVIEMCGCMDSHDNYFEIKKEINYCPICGEKLS